MNRRRCSGTPLISIDNHTVLSVPTGPCLSFHNRRGIPQRVRRRLSRHHEEVQNKDGSMAMIREEEPQGIIHYIDIFTAYLIIVKRGLA